MSAWGVVRLETPSGPVYIATDDDVAADLRAFPDPDGNPRIVLARSELDGLLTVASRTAPPDYLRLTLWRELHALVALKRALPCAGTAAFLEPGQRPGSPVDVAPQPEPAPIPDAAPETEQLGLL